MGVDLNRLFIVLLLFISFAFSNTVGSLTYEQKEVAKLMHKKLLNSIVNYDKKALVCDEIEKKNILNQNIFTKFNYTNKEMKKVLYFIWYSAKENCRSKEKNELAINFYKFKLLIKEYKLNNKYANEDYLKYLTIRFKTVLKDELEYLRLTNEKTRKYFNSLKQLKKPFNFESTMQSIKTKKNFSSQSIPSYSFLRTSITSMLVAFFAG